MRFMGGVTIAKRKGWNLNANVTVDLAYRIFKKDNQYWNLILVLSLVGREPTDGPNIK